MSAAVVVSPGQIYFHKSYYLEHGVHKPKYFLVLAKTKGNDIIYRLLTSRQNGRPVAPACYNSDPYPGFYLGVIGGRLSKPSWLDLRKTEDFDDLAFRNLLKSGVIAFVSTLPSAQFCDALECTAQADDTTIAQERCIRDQKAAMNCC